MSKVRDNTAQDGFGLVMVLLLVLTIAAILTPTTTRVKIASLHSTALSRVEQLDELARSVSLILISNIGRKTSGAGKAILTDSSFYRCHVGAITVDFAVQNHAGLIDLNRASAEQLRKGFQSLEYDGDMADQLAATVVSFRQYKASDGISAELEVVGGLKKAPFETISELFDIRELRRIPLRRLARTFTTYSGSAQVAPNTAPAALVGVLTPAVTNTGGGDALEPRPGDALTVAVRVAQGNLEGNFDGVYRLAVPPLPRLLERWHSDMGEDEDSPLDEGVCSDHFGPEFAAFVEMAV